MQNKSTRKKPDEITVASATCETKDGIDPALAEVLSELNAKQKSAVIKSIQAISQESFSGPIPHPDILMGYDRVNKGLADRIVRMAEKEQDGRLACNKKIVNGPINATKRGQWMGFIIAILFLGTAIYFATIGLIWLAGLILGSTIVALVTVFVVNKPSGNNDKHFDDFQDAPNE